MKNINIIGIDIAKNVFQAHGVDGEGVVSVRCKLCRREIIAYFCKFPPV